MKEGCLFKRIFKLFGAGVFVVSILHVIVTYASDEALGNESPAKLTVLEDTPVYDAKSDENDPVGVIAAIQSVRVTGADRDELASSDPSEPGWYRVQTWLGEKWLRSGPSIVNGDYSAGELLVTFPGEMDVYDRPAEDGKNGARLSPQTVSAIGRLVVCNDAGDIGKASRSASSASSTNCQRWFHILTGQGEKWIHPAKAVEQYGSNRAKNLPSMSGSEGYSQLSSKIPKLEPLFARLGVEALTVYREKGSNYLEVRKLYHHREKLTEEEAEALKKALFEEIGGTFPLSITTYTLPADPDVTGKIVGLDKENRKVLIVNHEKRDGIENSHPDAVWVRLTADACIGQKVGIRRLTLDDLKAGQTVNAWSSKYRAMSYPAQTSAYELVIVEEAPPGVDGIPLGTILGLDLTRIDKIELEFEKGSQVVIQSAAALQAVSERMKHIGLKTANRDPDKSSYTMTLYQGNRKAVYPSNLWIQNLVYGPTALTNELDAFILTLK
ncbi:YobA family protein [Paenibacillus hamazuiensis]|uniref:YobA family protein n=1 Tax=Paenibacillus hamazuiensis TaxID=2936508 RepID=UPI00200E900F|nr:YobA family protein [Paenibacillus hamazuiensis]